MRETVFLHYTQAELDRNYDQRGWVSNACPSRKSYPHVAMMQSGQDLCGDDGPSSLDAASSRRVLAQPQVRSRLIVIERIQRQDPS